MEITVIIFSVWSYFYLSAIGRQEYWDSSPGDEVQIFSADRKIIMKHKEQMSFTTYNTVSFLKHTIYVLYIK